MIGELDARRVRLKPYYNIIDNGEKVFLMMAPCEVSEIPRADGVVQLLRELEKPDGVCVEEIEGADPSSENGTAGQAMKELWSQGSLMSLDGGEFLKENQRRRLEAWLPLISRFTSRPYEIAARLAECRLGIFTNNHGLGMKIKKSIRQTQLIREVPVYENDPVIDWQKNMAAVNLAIVVSMGFHPAFFLEANEHALGSATPMLPVILMPDGFSGIVGPLVIKDQGPCWNCFYRRYAGQGTNLEVYDMLARLPAMAGDCRFVWSGSLLAQLIAPEIIFALTNIELPRTLGRVFFVDLLNFNSVEHPVLRLPRCAVCGSAGPGQEKPCVSPYAF